ncbi:MAG TPA: outer membrane protein assembly factor BamE [Nitrospiraceae bacterium]|nr:outer membrane protein assembly factor BamE [Nitrospiraceae bacterium]
MNQVTPGISTKSQVKRLFGPPSLQRFSVGDQGGRIWIYEYSRSEVNPLAFIPFMSFALLACCEWHTVETRTLIVEFGPDEVVHGFTRGVSVQ